MPKVAPDISLTEQERARLEQIVSAPSSEQRKVFRAKILLLAAQGLRNQEIAERLETSRQTVGTWRARAAKRGIEDLADEQRSGRGRTYDAVEEAKIIAKTLEKPPGRTHWSAERLAKEVRASAATILRIWRRNGLQPHRIETFKYSTDPLLEKKVADIVGLYLEPPKGALVLCVDEKSQIQAPGIRNVAPTTTGATRNSCASCGSSIEPIPKGKSIWCWTIPAPTPSPTSRHGWRNIPASTVTSRPLRLPG